jgi:hypothetical protein
MNTGGADARVFEGDDSNYVRFSKLLAKAIAEGRVDGKHRCPTCGMRYKTEAESMNCCGVMARSA